MHSCASAGHRCNVRPEGRRRATAAREQGGAAMKVLVKVLKWLAITISVLVLALTLSV